MSNTGTSSFPTAYDAFDNPTSTTLENQSGFSHSALHSQVHEAIEKIETSLGTHSVGTAVFAKRNNESFGTPDITGGTMTDAAFIGGTLTSMKFDGGTVINAIVGTPSITGGTINLNVINSNGQEHIKITPGTAKLVAIQTVRQNITTNTYQPNTIIQYGWNYIQGDGSNTRLSKDITFPIPFQSAPVVRTNFLAFCGSTPVSITNFTTTTDSVFEWRAYNIGTSTFRAEFKTPSSPPGTANFVGFSWEAFGTIA